MAFEKLSGELLVLSDWKINGILPPKVFHQNSEKKSVELIRLYLNLKVKFVRLKILRMILWV